VVRTKGVKDAQISVGSRDEREGKKKKTSARVGERGSFGETKIPSSALWVRFLRGADEGKCSIKNLRNRIFVGY